jgi:hypothetical protein
VAKVTEKLQLFHRYSAFFLRCDRLILSNRVSGIAASALHQAVSMIAGQFLFKKLPTAKPFLFGILAICSTLGHPRLSRAQSRNLAATELTVLERSGGSLHLAMSHPDGTPYILIANTDETNPILEWGPAGISEQGISEAAKKYISQIALPVLGIPSSATLCGVSADLVDNVWHIRTRIAFDGIEVRERTINLEIGALNGKVMMLLSNLPTREPNTRTPSLSLSEATKNCSNYFIQQDLTATIQSAPKLVIVSNEEEKSLTLCYEAVCLENASDHHPWRITIDATSGALIEAKDLLEYEVLPTPPPPPPTTAAGRIFAKVQLQSGYDSLTTVPLPSTFVTVNGKQAITDSLGYWSIPNLSPPFTFSTNFSGPYHYASRGDGGINGLITQQVTEFPITTIWTDANSDIAERDAYRDVAYAHNYVRTLDPALTKLDDILLVNVNLDQTCNAFYNSTNISLNFFKAGGSRGCSNTGQISDVVYHEFGHRVTDARYTQHGGLTIVDGSLGEGFADLNSAFMRDDPRIGIGFFAVGSTLRNCNNTNKWPTDVNADIHITGEIISGAVWDLRKLIGHDTAERLFHMMGYHNPDGTGSLTAAAMQAAFVSVLMAFLVTDDDDNNLANGTPHAAQILKAFGLHNIGLTNFITMSVSQIADADSTLTSYPVTVHAKYTGQVGSLDRQSVKIFYSNNSGRTYSSISLQDGGGDSFTGAIPKLASGSIVKYYATASTSLDNTLTATAPLSAPANTLSFIVGFHQRWFDDAEKDNGWQTSLTTDKATTGLWTRAVPYGTYSNPSDFVQQDTDHTPTGTMCYVTGNANAATKSRSISLDDVDNGSTTLTSPSLAASNTTNPLVRYWYYYRNDAGSNPGASVWQTFVSGNGGKTWRPLQNTITSVSGWTPFIFRLSDYVVPSDKVMLRFIATDNTGAIVEAGIDDIELLDGPNNSDSLAAVAVRAGQSGFALGTPYPNPGSVQSVFTIPISLPQSGHVLLQIKNVLGETIQTPIDTWKSGGSFLAQWQFPGGIAAGVYWAELQSVSGLIVQRIVIK